VNFIPKIVYNSITYTFPAPPTLDPLNEDITTNVNELEFNTGARQVQYNFTKQTFQANFMFLSETDKTSIQSFFDTWGKLGKTFTYYKSSDDSANYANCFLTTKRLTWKRDVSDGAGGFLYSLTLDFALNYQ
jgi:hypothetical protein